MARPNRNRPDSPQTPRRRPSSPDEGVSPDERSVLGRLTGLNTDPQPQSPEPLASPSLDLPRSPRRSSLPSPSEPLSPTESSLRNSLLRESDRILREDLPEMFPPSRAALPELDDDSLTFPSRASDTPPAPVGLGKRALHLLSAPARWLGPAVVTAIGLIGVLLLIALLVVILVRVLTRT